MRYHGIARDVLGVNKGDKIDVRKGV